MNKILVAFAVLIYVANAGAKTEEKRSPAASPIFGKVDCGGSIYIATGTEPTIKGIDNTKIDIKEKSDAIVSSDNEAMGFVNLLISDDYFLRIDASTWYGGRNFSPWFTASAKLFKGTTIVGVGYSEGVSITGKYSTVTIQVFNTQAFLPVSANDPFLHTNALSNIPYELAKSAAAKTVVGTDRLTCTFVR